MSQIFKWVIFKYVPNWTEKYVTSKVVMPWQNWMFQVFYLFMVGFIVLTASQQIRPFWSLILCLGSWYFTRLSLWCILCTQYKKFSFVSNPGQNFFPSQEVIYVFLDWAQVSHGLHLVVIFFPEKSNMR